MKIVHIITRLIVGGAQENTLLSCDGQHALGHDVTLVTGPSEGPEGSLMKHAETAGYRVVVDENLIRAVNPKVDYAAYRSLAKTLRDLDPDIVHTHSSKAGILGRWAAHKALRGRTGKIVHTIHGLAFTASTRNSVNAAYRFLERRTAPVTDKIVCVATDMATQSLAARIGKPDQYVTVFSGMDTRPFLDPPVPRDTTRERLGLTLDDVVVGTIARLFHMKGHDDLLALAPQLCAAHPTLKFLWLGDGILRPQFERQIAAMNLQDRFVLPGLIPPAEIPQYVNAMDVLVHPSRREGLARALPQGQLAGCPVVTYDVDGNREGLIDGETGYLVPPFDRGILAERLTRLLTDRSAARRMGRAGRSFAAGRFDTSAMVAGLEKVYRELF